MKVKKDYTILKVYSFICIQNKIVDLLKKALGGCRLQDLCIMIFPLHSALHQTLAMKI